MFFIARLSNEHASLPFSELKAIIESEPIDMRIVDKIDEYVVLRGDKSALRVLMKRAALVKEYGLLLTIASANEMERIKESVDSYLENSCIDIEFIRGFGPEFADYVKNLYRATRRGETRRCEKNIKIVFVAGIAIVYEVLAKRRMHEYYGREPHRRPVYRPGTMKPLLARAYVNLARVSSLKKETVVDPFCGVGGFVIEACWMGLHCVCIDIDKRMIEGARANSYGYECDNVIELIHGDAALLPLRSLSVDGIATDPPYGRQSVPRGYTLPMLLCRFIDMAREILRSKRFMVFAAPITLDNIITSKLREADFKVIEKHLDWVHGALTRVIYVVQAQ